MSTPNPSGQPNIYLLAADASPHLLPTLQSSPTLLNTQDSTGYSLLHALASYNHLSLLRTIHSSFATTLNPNLTDSDGETALFVVETVAAAECLVDELGIDWRHQNHEGETAEEKIRAEGEFVAVADYLAEVRKRAGEASAASDGEAGGAAASASAGTTDTAGIAGEGATGHPPKLPPGLSLEMGQMTAEQAVDELGAEPDPEFKRRIEQLAARDDFQSEEGQRELRELVQDAVRGVGGEEGREAQRQRTG